MSLKREDVTGFSGMDTEAHPSLRPPSLLQKDEGSNHEREGVWAPRRGATHANVTKKALPIVGLCGVLTVSGDFALMVADQTYLYSEAAFDE